jgi:DNA-directed RNA polymerase specialized sigma24 family protein
MPATDSHPKMPGAPVEKKRSAAGPGADERWRAGLRARNRDALEQVYCEYSGQVMHFLSLVEPGRSPLDACLDVFEKLWHSAAGDALPGALSDRIFRLAYLVLRQHAESAESLSSGSATVDSTCPAGAAPSPRLDVGSAVERLGLEQRVIVALIYGSRLSLGSVSRITAMTDQEITGHLHEARARLRHELLLESHARNSAHRVW